MCPIRAQKKEVAAMMKIILLLIAIAVGFYLLALLWIFILEHWVWFLLGTVAVVALVKLCMDWDEIVAKRECKRKGATEASTSDVNESILERVAGPEELSITDIHDYNDLLIHDSADAIYSSCSNPNVSVHNSSWLDYGGVEAELLNIDLMEGYQFELWCAALLRENGFVNVEVTRCSGDAGVDILAEKDSIRYAIQCKRYAGHVGNTPVQEVHAGKVVYNCHVGAVMTNQYFTEGGKRVAAATGTLLWDRDWLRAKISEAKSISLPTAVDPPLSPEELDGDELLPLAVDIVLETGQASVSMLQKRLNLGYTRAARIVDEMEEKGIVGPFRGSKPREILITKEQWQNKKMQ